jgi:putative ABC transport system permease protein
LDRFEKVRTGAVVSRKVAQRYNWKIGDHIPLRSSIWNLKADNSSVWTFDIVGIFDTAGGRRTRTEFLFHHDYFDEARTFGTGTVGWYIARISDPALSTEVAASIDAAFANSPNETRTQNEQEKAQAILKQHGDISLIVNLIVFSVFFTLLLLTGNTMMQSMRERIPEFAILKTLGYSSLTITQIVLMEALSICIGAAISGLIVAWMLFPLLSGITSVSRMPASVVAGGLLMSAVLAGLTAAPAAIRVRRINVVDALAGR